MPSLPPVFTNRCFKLVSDQFPIFFGSTVAATGFPGWRRSAQCR
jgi:hypothetical protein